MFVRGKYGPMCCLVDVLGARAMLEIRPSIPEDIMIVMTDQTVVPHVRLGYSIYDLLRQKLCWAGELLYNVLKFKVPLR